MPENQKINVLWLVDHLGYNGFMHGAGKYYLNTIPYFDQSSYNVLLCVLRSRDNLTSHFEKKGINVVHLGRSKLDPLTIVDIIKIIKNNNIDLIHCHGYGSANFGRLARVFTSTKVIVHSHDDDRYYPLYQKISDRILKKFTDLGIAVSEAVKKASVEIRKIPEEKMLVLHNGIIFDEFKIPEDDEISIEKKKWNLEENSKIIGTIAKLREEKGVEYLIRAVPHVLKEFPNSNFIIVGDGNLRDHLENLAKELGVGKNIIFTGFLENVTPVLSTFDVQVLPSITEGFGLVIVEGMTMGKPVIATNVGGVNEIIKDGENGLLVSSRDPEALADKIIYLLKNPEQAKNLGITAKVDSRRFDIKIHVKKLEEQYSRLSNFK